MSASQSASVSGVFAAAHNQSPCTAPCWPARRCVPVGEYRRQSELAEFVTQRGRSRVITEQGKREDAL